MFEGVTERIADFSVRAKFDDLSQETVNKIKQMVLDAIGCALGSYVVDRARFAIEMAGDFGGNPQASIIGNHRTSCELAAFVNSELINALDYDYLGPMIGHVGPYVTSPCLAMAEHVHASGKDLITALAVAHEIGGRVVTSLAIHRILKDVPPYYEESPRFSYSSAVFGGVAGAGKLIGLDAKRMSNALGIAGASTPVPAGMKWEHTSGPAIMVKYNCWSGWIARLAVAAVWLAEKGFTGDTTILDGEHGFWKIVGSPFFKVDNLLGGLGENWHIKEVRFKPYPTCSLTHGGIDGINKLMREHEIKPEEIEEILVKGDPIFLTPNRMGTTVVSFADTQFFNSYIFALAPYHGNNPSPAWQMPGVYNDPRIKALVGKVKTELHPRADELLAQRLKEGKYAFWDTMVEIAASGKRFATEVSQPKGSPSNPMTETEFLDKFRTSASYSLLSSSKVGEIIEITSQLEKVDDITKLTALLSVT